MAASPSSPTVRRNCPRRARPPLTPARSATQPRPPRLYRLLDEAAAASTSVAAAGVSSPLPPPPPTPPAANADVSHVLPPPPPTPTPTPVAAAALPTLLSSSNERLKVYLRIRPLPAPAVAPERGGRPGGRPKAKEQQQPRRPPPKQAGVGDEVCLVATGPGSVALTVPQCKVIDGKRGRVATEVFDGFSAVLPPNSSQAGRLENVVGWYHSHPGYGCWLSGIDVLTQMLNQHFQEPFLAVVIDPTRTVSADIRRCVLHYERASSTLSSSTFTSVTDDVVKVMLLFLPFYCLVLLVYLFGQTPPSSDLFKSFL